MLKLHVACRHYPHMAHLLEEALYARRKRMKISQDDLAERTGLSRNCIQQMECHEHLPQINTLFEIMRALAFSEEEFTEFWKAYQNAYLTDRELQKGGDKNLVSLP